MTDPRISPRAQLDLEEAWAFLSQRNETAADRLIDAILKQCRIHAQFPLTGRPRDDLSPGLRSFNVSPYVIFFRSREETIEVVRLLHGSRDVETIIKEDSV